MLKIIPDSISNEAPGGEKKFFNLIKGSADQLKNWTVFWDTQIDIHNYKKDGQCDFIFLGPPGLFVIEVKGGDHYECINGIHRWGWINSKIPLNEKRESPLNQAKGNLYSIENYLKSRIVLGAYKQMNINNAPIVNTIDNYVEKCIDIANEKKEKSYEFKFYLKSQAEKKLFEKIEFVRELEKIFISVVKK